MGGMACGKEDNYKRSLQPPLGGCPLSVILPFPAANPSVVPFNPLSNFHFVHRVEMCVCFSFL